MTVLPHDEAGHGLGVVLLHAGVADRSMWREHLGPLAAAGFRAVAIDLPGFGDAVPVAADVAMPLAPWNDVLETMTALGLEDAVLVGNSWGAAVALRAVVVAPARVAGLVLISGADPWAEAPSPALAAAWEAEETALAAGDVDGAVQSVLEAWVLPDAQSVRAYVAKTQRREFTAHAGDPEPDYAPDPLDAGPGVLTAIACPALCTCGEHEMPDFSEFAPRLAALLPAGRSTVIAGAGHLAPLETPERFRGLLLQFLEGEATQ